MIPGSRYGHPHFTEETEAQKGENDESSLNYRRQRQRLSWQPLLLKSIVHIDSNPGLEPGLDSKICIPAILLCHVNQNGVTCGMVTNSHEPWLPHSQAWSQEGKF
jgi:hypothetical protein